MNLWMLLIITAVVASVIALWRGGRPLYAGAALAASGLELLMARGIVRFHVEHLPLPLILGGVLAAAGVLLYLATSEKLAVAAATLLATVGAIQVLSALHL